MISVTRVAVLGATGIAAAVVLAVAGVDWLDTGTARRRSMVDPLLPPPPPVAMVEKAIERSAADESARRDLTSKPDVLSLARAADTHITAMQEVATLSDVLGPHAESALASAALSHADIAVREEAIHALGERGGPIALHTLQQALQDPSQRIRKAALRSLVDVGGAEAVSILVSALGATDAALRVNTVDALGEIGGPDATRYLEQMLQDENDAVREAAAEWLAELSG